MPAGTLRFVTFEGGEGAGKSTQIRLLAEALRAAGQSVEMTREPGGTEGAEQIRKLLVEGAAGRWQSETEALLHFAARAEHLAQVIRPALAAGKWVLCDRFADSTLAYQGYGQGLDLEWLWTLRRHIVGPTEPGLTIMMDLPVEKGLARAETQQRYERMGLDFHRRLADGFRQLATAEPDRCRIVDASRERAVIAAEIAGLIRERFGVSL
ncbi:dTMP kinase [Dongia rigui]|uniref:Thymidylate kinase n=1 Tax=Dongia rigui TaxID=940149 RepID=A0ABU5E3Y9_9PROT|nr:dTMP kinase [Dongia rigui]MDY0874258.1 dTMP kinase [Dongia rigui]